MDGGKNVSPQWSPDGNQIAFVSDRDGVSNVFLFDLGDQKVYQLTDLFTGAQGILPLSPVLSWAREADLLAFVYYTRDQFEVYAISDPRSLKKEPWQPPAPALARGDSARGGGRPVAVTPIDSQVPSAVADTTRPALEAIGSIYVGPQGFRPADQAPALSDSAQRPVTITALMDSVSLPLPDTAEFKVNPYRVSFQPDFIARPTIGYTRDTFGRGFYGGSAIALSDLLGNHQLIFAAYVNGRLSEALIGATYVNTAKRLNWAATVSQEPYYFFEPSEVRVDDPVPGQNTFVTNLRRIVVRSVQGQAIYPLTRFQRFEFGLTGAVISDRLQQVFEPYNRSTLTPTADATSTERSLPGATVLEPGVAYVFDNSLPGYVGPFYGRRYRLQASQSIGGWRYFQGLVDYRRYDRIIGPFTFATRLLYFGRMGRDAERFRLFLGNTELIRGNTSGSYYRNECRVNVAGTYTGCIELDRLVGTQLAVGNAELRFPILNASLGFVPIGFPPIEGALFYDIGIAWNDGDQLRWNRRATDDPLRVRTPSQTFGIGARMNLFNFVVLRLDYSIPQERRALNGYWTLSLGPVF
jgi:hypothetical protein